ncbi:TIGR04282 family arsenosugar biosynthesis glycosyltransferase [Chlorobium limicola]
MRFHGIGRIVPSWKSVVMHEVSSHRLLAVLTRNPAPGRVKTRLASTVGTETALHVYRTLREYTAGVINKCHMEKAVFYSDDIPAHDCFLGGDTLAFLQGGHDFGARMHHTFTTGFSLDFRRVVLIGTDCPEIDTCIIETAFTELENHDAVLGPARDGGFYLIGLKQERPELFRDRTWSHALVLHETIDILDRNGASYFLLPELQDIDTFEDLKQSRLWPIKA